MFLKRAEIRHFRSLDQVDVEFTPITVVVGPNGVGKSNFIDALKFFRDMAVDGLDHAVVGREGIDRIRQMKSETLTNSVGLSLSFTDERATPAKYELTLSGHEGHYYVESEHANWTEFFDPSRMPVGLQHAYERTPDGELTINGQNYKRKPPPDALVLGQAVDLEALGGPIAEFAHRWHFCALYPNTLRKLSPPTRDDSLAEDGSNWASVVRALMRGNSGREALERIAEVMRAAVEGYADVSVETAGSYLVPRISIRSDGKELKFDPVQLSDGTLRIFGILLALYQLPAPALLVIEEPEQTVHPGVLPALAEACKEASQRTQIIITTHSPHLVDQFPPEQIRVAWQQDGLTRISPIRSTQVEAVKRRLMSLQEYMLAEGLQPEVTLP